MVHVGSLWMRFRSSGAAAAAGRRFAGCPKVHFWGNRGAEAYIILKVPEGRCFWSGFIRDNPWETFRGVKASLTYLDAVHVPGSLEVSYEKTGGDASPCGSVCRTCSSLERCGGCPALSLE